MSATESNGSGRVDAALLEWMFSQGPIALSVFDPRMRFLRLNKAASALLGVTEASLRGRPYPDGIPENHISRDFQRHLGEVVQTGEATCFESFTAAPAFTREQAWTVWMWPLTDSAGVVRGVSVSAFDSSEQHWARQRLALINEAGARLGTTLDVTRTAEELTRLVVPMLADFACVDLLDSVLRGDEPAAGPVDSGVLLRRVAHHSEADGVPDTVLEPGAIDSYPQYSPAARALAIGRPVVSGPEDPDFARWMALDDARAAKIREYGVSSIMAVPLRARGIALGVAVLIRNGHPQPFEEDDAVLAEELAGRAALCVDNARRFTWEHNTALTLQRSLLPRELAGQVAVEVASRYLPAGSQAGVGGDWFDVIPLSGTRVALVVGDVVGHGIHASATMGRLRTAVRTLADVDLPPDELLTHLDDMVTHLAPAQDADVEAPTQEPGIFGATCLYAVYDPASQRCTVASAGHPAPVLRRPDGTTEVIRLHPGPPLGVGGLPFEARELDLPEGSVLALCTDGLLQSRDRDFDAGLEDLRRVLAAPADSLEEVCDAVMQAVLPERATDDVALLLARTRALNTDQVATWDLPSEPAVVASARKDATSRLIEWGLEDMVFVTELVLSELVTNAIRYGQPPVRLRLIRDRTLICEVSDGSNTAPHLRRARIFDEGGRGLLLVAQLTQRWGTRQAAVGKTIWAEQPLP